MNYPRRIFLDTSVINFIVEYYDVLFDGAELDHDVSERVYDDLQAIARIFNYASHNAIEMIISKTTFEEVNATKDLAKRQKLDDYCKELWTYFHLLIEEDFTPPGIQVKYFEEFLSEKGLKYLGDASDRKLLVEALFYKCDIFCTRDWSTILKYREQLKEGIPIQLLTPIEWYFRYSYKKAY